MVNQFTFTMLDEHGNKATHQCYIPDTIVSAGDAALETLVQAVGACSHAGIPSFRVLVMEDVTDVTGQTAFPSARNPYTVEDKLILQMANDFGQVTHIAIPAPNQEQMAEDENVLAGSLDEVGDFRATDFDDLVLQIGNYLIDKGAQELKHQLKNWRSRRNRARK